MINLKITLRLIGITLMILKKRKMKRNQVKIMECQVVWILVV
jgi:hypothetical protein